jgi:hypothetical protein
MKPFVRSFLLFFAALFTGYYAHTQIKPIIQWQKTYGGSDDDELFCVTHGSNGGYIMTGSTWSNDSNVGGNHGQADLWVVYTDNFGKINWTKCFGGTKGDGGESIITVPDGYIVAGYSASSDGNLSFNHGGNHDAWILKLDIFGNLVWQKTYGGSADDIALSIVQTNDGGYIFTGHTNSNDGDVGGLHNPSGGQDDIWVVKINDTGMIEWQKCLGGSKEEQGLCIRQTADNGYIVSGITTSNDGDVSGLHDSDDVWIIKLNNSGSLNWAKCYGGSGNESSCWSIQQTTDSGYIAAGSTDSHDGDFNASHGNYDLYLLKLGSDGSVKWTKTYGGTGGDGSFAVVQCSNYGYVIGGVTNSINGDVNGVHIHNPQTEDAWVVRTDDTGKLIWQKCLGGSNNEGAYSLLQVSDSEFVIGCGAQSTDGDVTDYKGGVFDWWLVDLKERDITGIETLQGSADATVSPNPAQNSTFITMSSEELEKNISYQITDLTGRILLQGKINSYRQQIDISNLANGVYLMHLQSPGVNTQVFKIVKQ